MPPKRSKKSNAATSTKKRATALKKEKSTMTKKPKVSKKEPEAITITPVLKKAHPRRSLRT